jgi:hypothetical protein
MYRERIRTNGLLQTLCSNPSTINNTEEFMTVFYILEVIKSIKRLFYAIDDDDH